MKTRKFKKVISMLLVLVTLITAIPALNLADVYAVPAGTETPQVFDFTQSFTALKNEGDTAVLGSGQTIKLAVKASSGVSYDSNGFVKYRGGNVLYLPLAKEDTSAVIIEMICSQENAARMIVVGTDPNGEYKVPVSKTTQSVQVDDIEPFVVVEDGVRYLPIISVAEVKAYSITVREFNPVNKVAVSGNIAGAAAAGITSIKFKNMDNANAATVVADVDAAGNYSVVLKRVAGNTNYVAAVTKPGYKVDTTADANLFTLVGNDATATHNFTIVDAPVAKASGTVTGIPADKVEAGKDLKVTLVPSNATLDNVVLTLTKNADDTYSFSKEFLEPDEEYSVVLENADDYEVTGKIKLAAGADDVITITAAEKAKFAVTGGFVTSDDKAATVTKITFTNMEKPQYTYTFDVTGASYSVQLRPAKYETSVVADGYTAFDHVEVADAAVSNDVYLQGKEDTSAVEYKEEVKVGKGQEFETITEALKYIARMERGASDRVTVVLTDALYREQIVIDIPNITFESALEAGSTITWYYGVGCSYYSAKLSEDGKSAYYDEAYAVDKFTMQKIEQNPGHWGSTVNLLAGATGFKADNIIFENSFNRYVTTEELADGAGANTTAGVTDRRDPAIDVKAKTAKERACVLYIQADDTEYRNCKLVSSQDTLYTGDATENSYFVNCQIEGNTDFICGDGNAVFDQCTLVVVGYSDQEATGSYIVANKEKASLGYLFYKCKIVESDDTALMPTKNTYLARSWNRGCKNVFIDTEVERADMIIAVGYTNMSGAADTVEDSYMYEYNTHTPDGVALDVTGRVTGTVIGTEQEVAELKITDWFEGFYATYYYADYTEADKVMAEVAELKEDDYTEESWKALQDAIATLEENLTVADQDKVDAAVKAIADAMAALERKTPPTGDTTNFMLYITILCAAAAAFVVAYKKRVRA